MTKGSQKNYWNMFGFVTKLVVSQAYNLRGRAASRGQGGQKKEKCE